MDDVACKISTAEWLVMKVLWQESPLTASNVVARLRADSSWSPKTVQTLMGRLVKKGALGVDKDSATLRQFYPLVSQEDCMREETKSFLHKVYGDSLHLMLTNFVKSEYLSLQEVKDLRNLLDARLT
ncbi:methicillin resistance regulatory protein MecI [Peptococcaceae bacterium CEB3]|nr:methicillin resistance regulatory protein MecI [Peptococcaceae bacterium CEB3]